MRRGGWGKSLLFSGWVGLGSNLVACGDHAHDCVETRTCLAPVHFIDAGAVDDWWDGGATGADDSTAEAGTVSAAGGRFGAVTSSDGTAGAAGSDESNALDSDSAPHVTVVSPNDGAVGVSQDASIQVSFDRPMDAASVIAAYASEDLPLDSLEPSWNTAHTTLTLAPKTPLAYATASLALGSNPDFPAKTYLFSFDTRALAANGQALERVSFSFSTLREVSTELAADPTRTGNWTDGEGEGIHNCLRQPARGYEPTVCVGDDSNNVRYTGFVSFDLSTLPADSNAISSARLSASGVVNGSVGALGPSSLEHLAFGELGTTAVTAPASESLGALLSNSALGAGTHVELSLDVTNAVARDFAAAESGRLSQYRLKFAAISANGSWDDLELPTSSVSLSLSYLVP